MIVEFIGLPASGKSTLAKSIYNELKNKKTYNIEIIYPLSELYKKKWITRNVFKLFAVIKHCILNFKDLIKVYTVVTKSQQKNRSDIYRLIFNLLFYLHNINNFKNSNKLVIFDEGLAHHLWAISINSEVNDLKYIENFIEGYIEDYIAMIIKVECPLHIVQERMLARRDNNSRHIHLANNLKKSYDNLNEIIKLFIKNKQSFIVVRNENESDITKNSILITKKIVEWQYNNPEH